MRVVMELQLPEVTGSLFVEGLDVLYEETGGVKQQFIPMAMEAEVRDSAKRFAWRDLKRLRRFCKTELKEGTLEIV